jgi:predicted RNA-binding Zn-ribbon protein involved in translation (DUF1610 family)
LAAGAVRHLGVPPVAVRPALLRTIRELTFELRTEQLSLLEAVRGTKLGAVTLVPAKLPIELRVLIEQAGAGTTVSVVIVDRWPGRVGRNWGATNAYVETFGAVLAAVDDALTRLDPPAAATFAPWWRDTGPGDVGVLRNVSGLTGRASAVLGRHTGRFLDGGSADQRNAVVSNAGAQTFTFAAPDSAAEVPTDVADAMLTAGTLIASRPGALPAPLAAQVQALVYRVEELLSRPDLGPGRFRLSVSAAEVPVVTFLHQQATMRARLPVRTLRICTTCRLEKVTNPDLERLQERSRRSRDLATGLSVMVSPYVAAGRLVQLNAKGPKFTCPRCQGLDADETVITYCQQCGERQTESALRACAKCGFDFRGLANSDPLWRPVGSIPPTPVAPGPPTVADAPAVPAAPAAPPLAPPGASAPPVPSAPPAPPMHGVDSSNWPRPPM